MPSPTTPTNRPVPRPGSETTDALEFLARHTSHIPNKGQVLQRYYRYYASRVRDIRRLAAENETDYEQEQLVTARWVHGDSYSESPL